jgi:hypothetical protein
VPERQLFSFNGLYGEPSNSLIDWSIKPLCRIRIVVDFGAGMKVAAAGGMFFRSARTEYRYATSTDPVKQQICFNCFVKKIITLLLLWLQNVLAVLHEH